MKKFLSYVSIAAVALFVHHNLDARGNAELKAQKISNKTSNKLYSSDGFNTLKKSTDSLTKVLQNNEKIISSVSNELIKYSTADGAHKLNTNTRVAITLDSHLRNVNSVLNIIKQSLLLAKDHNALLGKSKGEGDASHNRAERRLGASSDLNKSVEYVIGLIASHIEPLKGLQHTDFIGMVNLGAIRNVLSSAISQLKKDLMLLESVKNTLDGNNNIQEQKDGQPNPLSELQNLARISYDILDANIQLLEAIVENLKSSSGMSNDYAQRIDSITNIILNEQQEGNQKNISNNDYGDSSRTPAESGNFDDSDITEYREKSEPRPQKGRNNNRNTDNLMRNGSSRPISSHPRAAISE